MPNAKHNKQNKQEVSKLKLAKQVATAETKLVKAVTRLEPKKTHHQVPQSVSTSQVQRIAASITNPMESRPVRFRDAFSAKETALSSPFIRMDAAWNTTSGSTLMAADTIMAFQFRDIYRSLVVYDANLNNLNAVYDFAVSNGLTTSTDCTSIIEIEPDAVIAVEAPYAVPHSSSQWKPHGDMMWCGRANDHPASFFFINGGSGHSDYLNIYFSSPIAGAGDLVIRLLRYENGIVQTHSTWESPVGAANASFTINSSGYFGIEIACGPTMNYLSVTRITFICAGATFRHLSAGGLDANIKAVGDHRVLSSSLMYTNKAAPLNLQGEIVGMQYSGSRPWDVVAAGGFKGIAESNGSTIYRADKGMYAFIKPTGPENFQLKNGPVNVSGHITRAGFMLDAPDPYVVIAVNVDQENGRDGRWTSCVHIEYETTDTWRPVLQPDADPEAYRDAFLIIGRMGQFSHNPNHLSKFWNSVKSHLDKGVRALHLNPKQVLAALDMVAPQVTTVARAIDSAIG